MTKKSRRVLFYIMVVAFIGIGAAVLSYAEGMRLDLKNWHFTSVGGMYIIPSPSATDIIIDGEAVKKNNGIFQKGTLVNGLYPDNHAVELRAPGYKPWKRTLQVAPSRVSEIFYGVLVPENPASSTGAGIKNFWATANGLLTESDNGTFVLNNRELRIPGEPTIWSDDRAEFISGTSIQNYVLYNAGENSATPLAPLLLRLG
ncbi:MAG: hypothetical protein V1489_02725, partial [Candidatus Liptonbacteria bacterium]